jgi:hypothetical protein
MLFSLQASNPQPLVQFQPLSTPPSKSQAPGSLRTTDSFQENLVHAETPLSGLAFDSNFTSPISTQTTQRWTYDSLNKLLSQATTPHQVLLKEELYRSFMHPFDSQTEQSYDSSVSSHADLMHDAASVSIPAPKECSLNRPISPQTAQSCGSFDSSQEHLIHASVPHSVLAFESEQSFPICRACESGQEHLMHDANKFFFIIEEGMSGTRRSNVILRHFTTIIKGGTLCVRRFRNRVREYRARKELERARLSAESLEDLVEKRKWWWKGTILGTDGANDVQISVQSAEVLPVEPIGILGESIESAGKDISDSRFKRFWAKGRALFSRSSRA